MNTTDTDSLRKNSSRTLSGVILTAAFALVLGLPFALRSRDSEPPLSQPEPATGPERTLVIISPHWEGVRKEFARAFSSWTIREREHPTALEWLDVGGTSDALRYVRSEFARTPDGIGIDLFFGGGVDPFLQLGRDGLLVPCTLPCNVLGAIPQTFAGAEVYDAEGRWFGACLSGFGIIYNRKVLEWLGLPRPRDWLDLGRPEYRTWIGSGDPRSSGSVHMAYEIILQAYGWEQGWAAIVRLAGNTRNFARAGSEVPKDTAIGEVACGMAIDVYAWRQVAEAGPERMGFVLPEQATVVNPDGIAVLKGAPNRTLAEQFVAFVLSPAGQKLWVLRAGSPGGPVEFELDRMSVIPGFAETFGRAAAVRFNPYDWKGGFHYDADKGSRRWVILNDLLGAAIIDTHAELASAWKTVIRSAPGNGRRQRLLQPPLSETELLELAGEPWTDPEFRAAKRTQWAQAARNRYLRIGGSTP